MPNPDRKALNRWAHYEGYADFDTYIQAGGSILDARDLIRQCIASLQSALLACNSERLPDFPEHAQTETQQTTRQALNSMMNAAAPALPADEPTQPPDTANAQIQGDDPV